MGGERHCCAFGRSATMIADGSYGLDNLATMAAWDSLVEELFHIAFPSQRRQSRQTEGLLVGIHGESLKGWLR